jgi:chromosome segregation ATPase
LASLLALLLAVRAGGESGRTRDLRSELEELRKDTKGTRKQQDQRDKGLRRTESELEKATRKLGQMDKRTAVAKERSRTERREAAERIGQLEAEVAQANEQAESLSRALEQTREELEASVARRAATQAEVEELKKLVTAQPTPADPEELLTLRERAQLAELKLAEQDAPLTKAVREVERLKEKALTQETLYTSIRSELSLKKDQIRQQREEIERLRATKVAFGALDED